MSSPTSGARSTARHREPGRRRPEWATWPPRLTHWPRTGRTGPDSTNHTGTLMTHPSNHRPQDSASTVAVHTASKGASVSQRNRAKGQPAHPKQPKRQASKVRRTKAREAGLDRHPTSAQWLSLPQPQRKYSVLTIAAGLMVFAFNIVLTATSPTLDPRALLVAGLLFGVIAVVPGILVRRGQDYDEYKFWEYPIAVSMVFAPAYAVAAVMSAYVGALAVRTYVVAPEKRLRAPVDFAGLCIAATAGCMVATISEPLTYPLGCLVILAVRDLIMFGYDNSRGGREYALQAWHGTWVKRFTITLVLSSAVSVLVYVMGPQRHFLLFAPLTLLGVFWLVQNRTHAGEQKQAWLELERVTGKFVAEGDDLILVTLAVRKALTLFNAREVSLTLYGTGGDAATQWSLKAGPNHRIETEVFANTHIPAPPALPRSNQTVLALTVGENQIGFMLLEWDPQTPHRPGRRSLTTTYGHVVASSLANARMTRIARQQASEKTREAEEDPLTGLGNRTRLSTRGPIALAESEDVGSLSALILLDLDGFKRVNDTLGHSAGDRVLVEVARRLKETVRQSDLAIRLGGDEFAILARDLRFPADAIKTASKIMRSLIPPVEVEGLQLSVETSIGIAIAPDDGKDIDTLLRNADIALYKSKAKGRGTMTRYSKDIDFETTDSLQLATDLRRAIVSRNELVLHYQPQINLKTGRVSGVEALVRWQHPTEGLLYPDRFVHIAEQSNLIKQFTLAILERALAGRQQMRKVLPYGTVSVNLSAHNLLDQSLPGAVERYLQQYQIAPHELVLEVTETAAANDMAAAQRVLTNLTALGCKIAMDDFGTGYATLDTLRQGAPVTEIKMDRGFVMDVATSERAAKVAKAIIEIAHAWDCKMVAEGVEDAETLQILKDLNCDEAQGYFWMRPSPLSEVMDWIGSQATHARGLRGRYGDGAPAR